MIQREPVSKADDTYSLGIYFLWEIITQEVAFSSVKGYKVPTKFATGDVGKKAIPVQIHHP